MTIIYRVETPEGFGPYSRIAPELGTSYNSSIHPEPDLEGLNVDFSMSFGFESLERLMNWFSAGEIEDLGIYRERWLVSKYEARADTVQSSQTQSVFDKKRAKLLGCFSLDELRGYFRDDVSKELSAELEQLFEPHAECVPVEQHESLRARKVRFNAKLPVAMRTEEERIKAIREMLSNLRDGCYYEIDWKLYVYRDGQLYLLDYEGLLKVSLEELKETAVEIYPVTKS